MIADNSTVAAQIEQYQLQPKAFIGIPLVFFFVATLALSLRGYVRAVVLRTLGLDDWLLLAAYVIFASVCALIIAIGVLELDRGLVEQVYTISLLHLIGTLMYVANQVVLKASLAVFFIRFVQKKSHKWLIRSALILYAVVQLVVILTGIFRCRVRTSNTTTSLCLHWHHVVEPINYVGGSFNAIIDWIFIAMPLVCLYRDEVMPRKRKISISLIMMFGIFGSVVSIARVPLIGELGSREDLNYFSKVIPLTLVSIIETAVTITCISLATIRPLIDKGQEKIQRIRGKSAQNTGGIPGTPTGCATPRLISNLPGTVPPTPRTPNKRFYAVPFEQEDSPGPVPSPKRPISETTQMMMSMGAEIGLKMDLGGLSNYDRRPTAIV